MSSVMENYCLSEPEALTDEYRALISELEEQAREEGRSIAEVALRWVLRRDEVTSVIVGASSAEQLKINLKSIERSL